MNKYYIVHEKNHSVVRPGFDSMTMAALNIPSVCKIIQYYDETIEQSDFDVRLMSLDDIKRFEAVDDVHDSAWASAQKALKPCSKEE